MSTNANDPSGTTDQTSGLEQETQGQEETTETQTVIKEVPKDFVAYDSYKKVLTEKKKFQSRLEELEAKMREKEEGELKSQQKWQDYAKLKETEASELKTKLEEIQTNITESTKMQSLLNSIKGEVPQKFWPNLQGYLEKVVLDPETNMPDQLSLEKAAKQFEADYPECIKKAGGPRLPNDAPSSGAGTLTYEQWRNLPLAEMKKRQHEVDPATL